VCSSLCVEAVGVVLAEQLYSIKRTCQASQRTSRRSTVDGSTVLELFANESGSTGALKTINVDGVHRVQVCLGQRSWKRRADSKWTHEVPKQRKHPPSEDVSGKRMHPQPFAPSTQHKYYLNEVHRIRLDLCVTLKSLLPPYGSGH